MNSAMMSSLKSVVMFLLAFMLMVVVFIIVNPSFNRSSRYSNFRMATNQTMIANMLWTSSSQSATTPYTTSAVPPLKVTAAPPKGAAASKATANAAIHHPRNPGCSARKVSKYKAVDMGQEYHHPSLIQYAKLAKYPNVTEVELSFTEYMAMMSAHKFLKPEQIMIHTYTDITGKYWDMVQKWDTKIVLNKVERVTKLHGTTVPAYRISHQADFVKVRSLYELGGIISDFDVIIINGKALKEMQRKAECVLSLENDFVNAGFNSCIKNSTFVQKWLNGYYTDYRRSSWMYNASYKPRSILTAASGTCYNMHVVANIAMDPNFSQYKRWLQKNGVQWRKKVAAHYFNKGLKNSKETALHADNSFGEMLRYVYHA